MTEKFKITAINQEVVMLIYSGLFLLTLAIFIPLIVSKNLSIFSGILSMLVPIVFYLYLKKYFTYVINIKLYSDRFDITSKGKEQNVLFGDIAFYKAELFNGVRLKIRLKNQKTIRIISTNSFGIDPRNLEEFLEHFEKRVKEFQIETKLNVNRKSSFFETKRNKYLIIFLSLVGFGAVIVELLRNGFSATMFIIIVPLLTLIATLYATIKRRQNL